MTDSATAERSPSPAVLAYAKLTRERLARRINEKIPVEFTRLQLRAVLTALELQAQRATHLDPALQSLRETLQIALQQMSALAGE